MTQAIILAAGQGSRLGNCHKTLLRMRQTNSRHTEETIASIQLDFLRSQKCTHVTYVVGWEWEKLQARLVEIAAGCSMPCSFVVNTKPEIQNWRSLKLALETHQSDSPIWIMNADTVTALRDINSQIYPDHGLLVTTGAPPKDASADMSLICRNDRNGNPVALGKGLQDGVEFAGIALLEKYGVWGLSKRLQQGHWHDHTYWEDVLSTMFFDYSFVIVEDELAVSVDTPADLERARITTAELGGS